MIAAPVVWAGMELARGYGPLAFSMALLAHSQVTAAAGDSGLGPVRSLHGQFRRHVLWRLVLSPMLPGQAPRLAAGGRWCPWSSLVARHARCTVITGCRQFRLAVERPPVRVAIIQGAIDTVFEDNPERPRETLEQYTDLTVRACEQYQPLDLVLWPETMFQIDDLLVDRRVEPATDRSTLEPAALSTTYSASSSNM